jgi:hypothetical protein
MVSLVDIVPQKRVVQIAAGELELRGLGLRQIAELFLIFPSLRNLSVANAPEVTAVDVIAWAPDAIGTIIAWAADQPEAAGKIVDIGSGIAADEAFECLQVIYELTFPRGINPFLERIVPLLGLLFGSTSGNGLDPSGGDQAMNMPPEQNGSSPPDIPLTQ